MSSLADEAEKAYERGLYAATIFLCQMAVEGELRRRAGRRGNLPYGQLLHEAHSEGMGIEPRSLKGLSRLKNRIAYEGHIPTRREARWALEVARESAERMKKGGSLKRLLRRLCRR